MNQEQVLTFFTEYLTVIQDQMTTLSVQDHANNFSQYLNKASQDRKQCTANTTKGARCANKAQVGKEICRVHDHGTPKKILAKLTDIQCAYVGEKKAQKGVRCPKKVREGNICCSAHMKYAYKCNPDPSTPPPTPSTPQPSTPPPTPCPETDPMPSSTTPSTLSNSSTPIMSEAEEGEEDDEENLI